MLRTASFAQATLTLALLSAPLAHSQTAYISDELTVPLRSGPSSGHRILHAGLPSGTQLEIINENDEAGFSQIRTVRGTEGWIRSQYLVTEPVAKLQLITAQKEVIQLKQRLQQAQTEVTSLTESGASQATANRASANEIENLKAELARINQISAAALETHEENLQLKEINARLRDELDGVSAERNLLIDNAENEAIMLGAAFVLIGLIAGVLIKARPQRSAWS
jgi:SH3 domain protein